MKHDKKLRRASVGIVPPILLATNSAFASSAISVFPDKSLIWQIINFLVLILILNLVVYRPIRNIIARRKERMDALDSNINKFQKDAADKENYLEEEIKTAKANGLKEKNALIEEANTQEKEIIEEINRKTQKTIADNKAQIAEDAKKVAEELQQEVEAFAVDISEKVLGRKVA